MTDVFYHVVTERPMQLGQVIAFDENHHSGVHERVYALKSKVDEVYRNPKAFDDVEFDHHTKVAFRELALEEVRLLKYPQYPSRLASLYVSGTLEEAESWYEFFVSLGRPTFQIVKVMAGGSSFTGDACNCFDGTTDHEENLKLADRYWQAAPNDHGDPPVYETLLSGKIHVIEIIKTNPDFDL